MNTGPQATVRALGLPFAARVAFAMAVRHTADLAPRRTRRGGPDIGNTRGLACHLLRYTGASWPEITFLVYGHHSHSTAIYAAQRVSTRWPDAVKAAEDEFQLLLEI